MGYEGDEVIEAPKLPLFSIPQSMQSPEPSGMLTPPLHTLASVPFRWEEEPGKPRPCTTLTTINNNTGLIKCLDLPPRLLITTTDQAKITNNNMSSPTTVLEGPYMGRHHVFHSSSFRIRRETYGSFGCSDNINYSPESAHQLDAMVLSKRGGGGYKERFGSWGRKTLKLRGKRDIVGDGGGSFVFSSCVERDSGDCGYGSESGSGQKVKMRKFRRSGSFLGLSHPRSPFWATIYEGLKQAIPWKSRKLKKERGW